MVSPVSSYRFPWGSICSTGWSPNVEHPCPKTPTARARFPTPQDLATVAPDELKVHGFSLTKARTIVETARAIVAGDMDLESLEHVGDREAIERLTSLRGVGRWTAEYVMLRGLGRCTSFPATTWAHTTSSGASSASTANWTTTACNGWLPLGSPTQGLSTSTCCLTRWRSLRALGGT